MDDGGESEESPIPCLSQRLAQRRRKTNTINTPLISLEKQTLVQSSLLATARVVRFSNARTHPKHRDNPSAYSPSKNSDLMESHSTLEKPLKHCCSTNPKEENEALSHAQLPKSRTLVHSSENPENGSSLTLIPNQEEKGQREVFITPPSSPLSKRVGGPNGATKVVHSPKKLALTSGGSEKHTSSSSTQCIVLGDSNSEEEEDVECYDVPLVERLKWSVASRDGGKSTGCRRVTSSAQGTAHDPIVL